MKDLTTVADVQNLSKNPVKNLFLLVNQNQSQSQSAENRPGLNDCLVSQILYIMYRLYRMSSEKCFIPLQRTDGKLVCPSCGGVESGLRRLISHTWTCKFPKGIQPCAPGATPMNVPTEDNVPGSDLRPKVGLNWSHKGKYLGKFLEVQEVTIESEYGDEMLQIPKYVFEHGEVSGYNRFSAVYDPNTLNLSALPNSPMPNVKARRSNRSTRQNRNRKNRTSRKNRNNKKNPKSRRTRKA